MCCPHFRYLESMSSYLYLHHLSPIPIVFILDNFWLWVASWIADSPSLERLWCQGLWEIHYPCSHPRSVRGAIIAEHLRIPLVYVLHSYYSWLLLPCLFITFCIHPPCHLIVLIVIMQPRSCYYAKNYLATMLSCTHLRGCHLLCNSEVCSGTYCMLHAYLMSPVA